jgi:hypothetical protein
MSDNILNPFKSGDRVVCLKDDWVHETGPAVNNFPKKGEVMPVKKVYGIYVSFDKYDLSTNDVYFVHWNFAPVQDATDMEFDDAETADETEVAHVEEMTV